MRKPQRFGANNRNVTPHGKVGRRRSLTSQPSVRREHVIQRRLDWNPIEGRRELSDTRLLPDEGTELVQPLASSSQATLTVIVEADADYHDRVEGAYTLMIERMHVY